MKTRLTCVKRSLLIVALIGLLLPGAACDAEQNRGAKATPTASDAPSAGSTSSTPATVKASKPAKQLMPCDPSSGFPVHKDGCPDPEPETGWLAASNDGLTLTLTPFRTLRNDAEGEAYAREHGKEYPFPNDYFDAPNGASHPLEISQRTVCTGIILVGYQEPLTDHVVACDELVKVAERRRVPAAVWFSGGKVIQASELYRP